MLRKQIRYRHELIRQTYLIMYTTCDCLSRQCSLYSRETRPHSAAYLRKQHLIDKTFSPTCHVCLKISETKLSSSSLRKSSQTLSLNNDLFSIRRRRLYHVMCEQGTITPSLKVPLLREPRGHKTL